MLSFLAIGWNAVRIDGVQPGQGLLAAAVAVLALDALGLRRIGRLPRGMPFGAALIGLAGLLTAIFPPSLAYIAGRFDVSNLGAAYGQVAVVGGNLTQLAKFEAALLGIVIAVLLVRPSVAEVRQLASAWAVSVLVSAIAAASDASGRTVSARTCSASSISSADSGAQVAQSNHLAVALALAMPVVLFWIVHGKRIAKIFGVAAFGLVAFGSYLAGSRGGFVGVLVAVALFALMTSRIRLKAMLIGTPFLVAVVCMALVASPALFATIATDLRLAGNLGSASNAIHALALQQGILDVQQNPIFGIGFDHLTGATKVHLQLLAAGGIIALGGYLIYWLSVFRASLRARVVSPALGSVLLASMLTFLMLNFVENQVATLIYVPAALLVGLAALQQMEAPAREPASVRRVVALHSLRHRLNYR